MLKCLNGSSFRVLVSEAFWLSHSVFTVFPFICVTVCTFVPILLSGWPFTPSVMYAVDQLGCVVHPPPHSVVPV